MTSDVLKKWKPIEDLPAEAYLEGLYHDYEGFRLLLKGRDAQARTFRITFDPALSYRTIDEGDYLNPKMDHSKLDAGIWTLFTVENSTYLKWFHEVSQGIHAKSDIVHYAIYTPNDCLDILSAYSPKVEWLN